MPDATTGLPVLSFVLPLRKIPRVHEVYKLCAIKTIRTVPVGS